MFERKIQLLQSLSDCYQLYFSGIQEKVIASHESSAAMIEHFRHEALNQVSVISGFCEIIENQLPQPTAANTITFINHLRKIKQLALSFHTTLQVFREECDLKDMTEAMLQRMDPTGDILPYLSPECAIQYTVMKETVEALFAEAKQLHTSCNEGEKISDRCSYVVTSSKRLHELFLRPFEYIRQFC